MKSLAILAVACMWSCSAAAQNPPANMTAGGAKIEQALLSTPQPGAQFAVSPKGIHMATLTHSGSRMVIIYDGVEGPKFDDIYTGTQAGVVFSPDGSRWAYCGRQGTEFVVMVDGKEHYRSSEGNMQGINGGSCQQMAFTSNSRHFYFFSQARVEGKTTDGVRVVWDGKADPVNANADLRTFAFSPDGNHLAYHWSEVTNRPTPASDKLLVDGKVQPYFGGSPQWSPDSQHLFTSLRFSNPKPYVEVMLDGKPFMRADDLRLFLPPAGPNWIALVTKSQGVPVGSRYLVQNGKVIPGSEVASNSGGINSVSFSPDGKHYAALLSVGNTKMSVFADGKRGLEYDNLPPFQYSGEDNLPNHNLSFLSESGKVAYVGYSRTGDSYLVVGDQESNAIRALGWVEVSPVGDHSLAIGQSQVAYDGKILQLAEPGQPMSLAFSPDGVHYAFVVAGHNGPLVYQDGVPQSAFRALNMQRTSVLFFSPDSKHLAYFCHSGDDQGVCVDGKFVKAPGGGLHNLTFSADSNHLFWNMLSGPTFRLFVDGKPVMDGGNTGSGVGIPKEMWQVDGDSLLILSRDNTGYKRVRVTPTGTSISTMLGQPNGVNAR